MDAGWMPDPTGLHELRYWDGASWTEHVSDQGGTAVDPLPEHAPPPPAPAPPAPAPPPAADAAAAAGAAPASTGRGGWKDKLKAAAQQAATQGKAIADKTKTAIAEQQAKRVEQWKEDPNTLWFGQSQSAATKATGMSKAFYRITKDRIWIDTGMLGVKSESVPLWAVRDLDVRQNVLQRGNDVGDVVLWLEDPAYSVDPTGALSMTAQSEPGALTSGEVTLDNVEGPYQVRELLMPLVSEARQKKLTERQTQFLHVNPGVGMVAGMAAQPQPAAPPQAPPAPGPGVDLADQLRKLADLRDQGVLTEEEFAAQKARLLGG
jgi:Protein of unknown function (DUF2510)/Short C-terminal domain/Bacterial PH domain